MYDDICPECGYYCLGKGGLFCINKPELLPKEIDMSLVKDSVVKRAERNPVVLKYLNYQTGTVQKLKDKLQNDKLVLELGLINKGKKLNLQKNIPKTEVKLAIEEMRLRDLMDILYNSYTNTYDTLNNIDNMIAIPAI